MKKLGFCLVLFLFAVTTFASVANASVNITETPDVKIVIEGEKGTYNDVTIIADGRTLLPLREVLTNLGVKNDDEHIIWDGTKRSVTVKKDDKVIYLEVGKTVGSVNGSEIAIDVAPIIYPKNNRTYIPARFVAESLGMEVVWDADTRSVLIADKANYNQIKDIITKSNEAMKDVTKFKFGLGMDVNVSQDEFKMDYDIDITAEVDQEAKAFHTFTVMNVFGINMEIESYLKDGTNYTKDLKTGEWSKEELSPSEYEELFANNSEISNIKDEDINRFSAGMIVANSENSDEILIKGDVLSSDFMKAFSSELAATGNVSDGLELDSFYMEFAFDKNTHYMKSMKMGFEGEIQEETGKGQMNMNISLDISDYNGDFEIIVPEEALQSSN
ncbi:MAG: copper amine oxidase N-terminal domain-containing protein [Clostridiaceae bacterium]|jgi:hypothetical protein|nr:copper amine oxidase N-terminal domain-containing protein [Clostridiaceae bacterium]